MRRVPHVLAYLGIAVAGGCAPAGLYDWGSYESSVQHMYADNSNAHAVKDRERLIEEVRKTESKGRVVPPGKRAQIGYLAWQSGDAAVARQYFEAEKAAYPEGAKLMDTLLRGLR